MNPIIKYALIAIAIVVVVFFIRSRVAKSYNVTVSEFSKIVDKLKLSNISPAWASIFTQLTPGDESSQIQLDYSSNQGKLEFSWTLLPPKNITDKDSIVEFLRSRGFTCYEVTAANGCPLVNITGPDLENVGKIIMLEYYKIEPQFSMYCEGITWP